MQTKRRYSNSKHPISANPEKLCLPTFRGFVIIQLDEVLYCEAQGKQTVVMLTGSRSVTVTRLLSEYEQLLSGTVFLRIHRSFLINLLHVTEYQRGEGGTVVMSNGAELEVSRSKKHRFLENMRQY